MLEIAKESTIAEQNFNQTHSRTAKKPIVAILATSFLAISLILPIGVFPRFIRSQELEKTHQKLESQLPPVSVTKVSLAPPSQKLSLPGTIEAIVEAPIYARSNGYIKERYVDIGDHVRAKQLLAKMETPEIEDSEREAQAQYLTTVASKEQSDANVSRAQSDLNKAVAQLSQAKASLIERQSTEAFAKSTMLRWQILGTQGAVSAQDVEEKETNYKTSMASAQAAHDFVTAAQSEVISARARLKAEQANVNSSVATVTAAKAHASRSSTERSFQDLVSPFAGIITERNIDQGSLISSGSDISKLPLFRVAQIDTAKVFVDVPQYAARGIHVGQKVDISLKEFPNRNFSGKVVRTAFALDSTARTLRTEIHIPNSDLTLAPGMYADVNFSMARPEKTLLIPANSLIVRAEGPQVLTLSAGNKIHYRQVKLGEDLGKQVEVVGGLSDHELVVVNPSDFLAEGTPVSVSE